MRKRYKPKRLLSKQKKLKQQNSVNMIVMTTIVVVLVSIFQLCFVIGSLAMEASSYSTTVKDLEVSAQMSELSVMQSTTPIVEQTVVQELEQDNDLVIEDSSVTIVEDTVNETSELTTNSSDYASLHPYTESDVKLLGDAMYAEEGVLLAWTNREDALRAHELCGSVILHRRDTNFEGVTTIREVLYAPGQYAQRTINLLGHIDTPQEIYNMAEQLLKDGPSGPDNLVWQASFKQGEVYEHIYNQYFCLKKNWPQS